MNLSEEYKKRLQKLSGLLNERASIGPTGELEDFDVESPEGFLYDPLVDKIMKMVYGMTGERPTETIDPDGEDGMAFDIAEAIHQYVTDYNEDAPHIHKLKELLRNNNYKPSPLYSTYEDLGTAGKMVYDGLKEFGQQL